MLFDILPRAVEALENRERLRKLAKDRKDFDDRLKILMSELQTLKATTNFIERAKSSGLPMHTRLPNTLIDDLLDVLMQLRHEINQQCLTTSRIELLRSRVESVRRELLALWHQYWNENAEGLVRTLEVIGPVASDGRAVQRTIAALRSVKESQKLDSAEIIQFLSAVKNGRALIDALGLDEPVQRFFSQVSDGKATIADLNDDVVKWLRQRNLEHRIALTFRTDAVSH